MKNKEFKDQKNFEAKKNYLSANNNNRNKSRGQSDQVLGRFFKKDSYSNRGSQQGQSFNTPTIGINATTIKKTRNKMTKT